MQPSGSKLLPCVPADVPAGTGSDGRSERRGKVRVTRRVKLDPSGQLAQAAGLHSPAGIISIRTHAGGGGITTQLQRGKRAGSRARRRRSKR